MANKNDPPEHQAPDLESGFKPDPAVSGTHFDGPPPGMMEMVIRLPHPGLWYIDEKGIPTPVTQSGRFSDQNPMKPMQTIHVSLSDTSQMTAQCGHELSGPMRLWSDHIAIPQPEFERYCNDPTVSKVLKDRLCQDCASLPVEQPAGVLPPQVVHLRKLFPNSDKTACGSPLSGPFTSWPHHVAILGSDFSKYLKDPILKPNLCSDCVALLDLPTEVEPKPTPNLVSPATHLRPKVVPTAQIIHARDTLSNPPKKGEPIGALCGMKMPPPPKKLGDTLPSDRTVSDKNFRRYLLNEPNSRPANSTLCGTCISAFMPNPKPSFIGNLAVSPTGVNADPKPSIIGDLAEARTDQHRRDLPEMPKTGDKMYFNENEPVPVVVLPGQRFEDIESGQKGHIIAQNLGTYLLDFKAEDGRVFKGLRSSRFVRQSDLRQWIKDNPGAHWMFPPPVEVPLHTEEYNDTLPPIHPADPSTYPEPPLYTVVKGVMAWQFFLHVPSPSPTDPDRTKWVNTRADWYEWSYVYEHLCKKNPDGSPVILGTATTEEFNKLPTPADWNKIKQAARDLVELGKKIGLI